MNFRASFTFLLLCLLAALSEAVLDENENIRPKDVLENISGGRRDLKSIITEEVLEDVFQNCKKTLKDRDILERKLCEEGRVVKTTDRKTDPSLIRMRKMDPIVNYREARQLPFDEASTELYQRYDLTRDEIGQQLPTLSLNGDLSQRNRDNCTQAIEPDQCDRNSRYRTANGQCNNLQNPTWGSAMSCQRRLLPANYVGNSGYRQSVNGGPLPAPRGLSLNLHYHWNRPTNHVTHMYMFFGQLLDHDMALTPASTTVDNEAIECCPPAQETHPQCSPILIARDDPFYSQYNVTCLNFVRSAICPSCTLGPREQLNQVTSFIDASFLYGNSVNETLNLRANDGTGRLRTQTSNYGDLLPASPNPNEDQCSFPETNDICFEAGDPRANQHTVLASQHTLWMRQHNKVATDLSQVNPQWEEEKLFQETRRIVAAQMQVIIYQEYLPITLGRDRMSYFDLWVGDTTRYDAQEDPSLILSFSTVGFRFGHSLINSVITNNPPNATNEPRLLRNEFFQPWPLYEGFIGPLVRGASNSPAQWFDQHLVPDVTNFLYRIRGDLTGLDLASFNINRGRDHGMPTYVEMVRFCSQGEIVIRRFSDLYNLNLMNYEQADALRRNYRNVNDVDMWPGILMEIPNENAVVGPTAACLIGLQFRALKFGDRFYFEHDDVGVRFTDRQRRELRKFRLSNLICLNTNVSQIARNAMIFNSRNNPLINCGYVRDINLSFWRE